MKLLFISMAIAVTVFIQQATGILGTWESKSSTGTVTRVVFKSDNTFEGYVNKKAFVSGDFISTDSTLSFTDNGCNGTRGTYRLNFYYDGDSLRFQTIEDACDDRRHGMENLVLGRVK